MHTSPNYWRSVDFPPLQLNPQTWAVGSWCTTTSPRLFPASWTTSRTGWPQQGSSRPTSSTPSCWMRVTTSPSIWRRCLGVSTGQPWTTNRKLWNTWVLYNNRSFTGHLWVATYLVPLPTWSLGERGISEASIHSKILLIQLHLWMHVFPYLFRMGDILFLTIAQTYL